MDTGGTTVWVTYEDYGRNELKWYRKLSKIVKEEEFLLKKGKEGLKRWWPRKKKDEDTQKEESEEVVEEEEIVGELQPTII